MRTSLEQDSALRSLVVCYDRSKPARALAPVFRPAAARDTGHKGPLMPGDTVNSFIEMYESPDVGFKDHATMMILCDRRLV